MEAVERFVHLTDEELLSRTQKVVAVEQCVTAHLIALLAEIDYRRLYLAQGFSLMFAYCTEALKLSEHAAYGRIEAARVARRFPIVLDRLAAGDVSLTTVCLLAGQLTPENVLDLLDEARHKSKREVEVIVARLNPVAPMTPSLRKAATLKPVVVLPVAMVPLPEPPEATSTPADPPRPVDQFAPGPLESYHLQVTLSRSAHDKLRCAQNLLRHSVPSGDLATILERALDVLLDEIERKKLAFVARPRSAMSGKGATRREASREGASRYIPAAVRRAVWQRDGGRCAFVGAAGRCTSRAFLELHHVRPFAAGGEATAENIELRCRAHNAHEADLFFGKG